MPTYKLKIEKFSKGGTVPTSGSTTTENAPSPKEAIQKVKNSQGYRNAVNNGFTVKVTLIGQC